MQASSSLGLGSNDHPHACDSQSTQLLMKLTQRVLGLPELQYLPAISPGHMEANNPQQRSDLKANEDMLRRVEELGRVFSWLPAG